MIKVLYPVNELKIGGAEQQLLELVRGLDKSRFQPTVAPLYGGGILDAEFRAVPGVEVFDVNRRGRYDPAPLVRIAMLLRRRKFDIVQPFLSPATLFGLVPALIAGTPGIVVTERCGVRRKRGIGYKTYRTIEDRLSRFADVIVPNSIAGKDLLLQRGLPESKLRVIYNGVNEERLNTNPEQVRHHRAMLDAHVGSVVIGILASLTPAKGHDTLLRAMRIATDRFPGIRLAIVGDGPFRTELHRLAAELDLTDRVFFLGYQRNVADFLSSFDLLVSASRDNEGCSNSILEAMTLGIPVIATDIGGNRELVKHRETGLLVPVGDPEALATAIVQILEEPDVAKNIAGQAREMISAQFSLERMVRDYEALYLALLDEPGRGVAAPKRRMVALRR